MQGIMAAYAAVATAPKPASSEKSSAPGMKGALDDEQRTEDEEARGLLATRQKFDLETETRAEIMREEGALRDMLMAELKNEDAYLKKWLELI